MYCGTASNKKQFSPPPVKGRAFLNNRVLTRIISIIVFIAVAGAVKFIISEFSKGDTEHAVQRAYNNLTTTGWTEYNATAGQFKILVPKYPVLETEEVNVPNSTLKYTQHIYSSEVDSNTVYYVVMAVYPAEANTSNPNANLEGAVNGTVTSAEGNELLSSTFISYKSYPAVDYVIENAAEGVTIHGRNILIDHKYYGLGVSNAGGTFSQTDYDKFISSLEFI